MNTSLNSRNLNQKNSNQHRVAGEIIMYPSN